MEFGKVPPDRLHMVDFTLPPDDQRSVRAMKKISSPSDAPGLKSGAVEQNGAPRTSGIWREPDRDPTAVARNPEREVVQIGCPVWGSPAWLGQLYPVGTPPKDFLMLYAQQVSTIELNTTHYRVPDLQTIQRWRRLTPQGFTFCPKFPQAISHRSPLGLDRGLVKSFLNSALGLGDRLGSTFLQLPPTFAPRDLPELRTFLSELNAIQKPFPIAVEVRHPAFFDNHRLLEPLFEILADQQSGSVITDVSGRRDVLHMSLPAPRAFVRFIGNGGDPSDDMRIAAWTERIETWLKAGIEQVYFFVHQPDDVVAPQTIAKLIDALNAKTGLGLKKWRLADRGTQMGFF